MMALSRSMKQLMHDQITQQRQQGLSRQRYGGGAFNKPSRPSLPIKMSPPDMIGKPQRPPSLSDGAPRSPSGGTFGFLQARKPRPGFDGGTRPAGPIKPIKQTQRPVKGRQFAGVQGQTMGGARRFLR